MAFDIKALEAEALAAEGARDEAALSDEEQQAAALIARRQKAIEDKAAADRDRRAIEMVQRERAAKALVGPNVMVKAVDLVALFDVGYVPPKEQLPGGGVIVVRSPIPSRMEAFYREAEAKSRTLPELMGDLVCEHTIDPKDAGALLRAFCDNYQPAAIAAGEQVAKLGGSRIKADKRGRG